MKYQYVIALLITLIFTVCMRDASADYYMPLPTHQGFIGQNQYMRNMQQNQQRQQYDQIIQQQRITQQHQQQLQMQREDQYTRRMHLQNQYNRRGY